MNLRQRRRWAGTLFALGLLLMVATAVAVADEPTATPTPVATETPIAEPVLVATLTPEPTPALTPEPTVALTPTATSTPTPTATPRSEPTVTWTIERPRAERPRGGVATPSPTATATATGTASPAGAQMTICVYNESDRTYSSIVIPANQYSPYFDEETTIIPAPYYGCENITDPDDAAGQKVTGCHATGDPAQPYTFFERDNGDFGGHQNHAGDLIPAPNRTCPTGTGSGSYEIPTPTPTGTASATAEPTTAPTVTPVPTQPAFDDPHPEGGEFDDPDGPGGDVLDETDDGTPTTTTTAAANESSLSSLPFTGADVWVLFVLGLSLVMMGSGLRLLQPEPGVTR